MSDKAAFWIGLAIMLCALAVFARPPDNRRGHPTTRFSLISVGGNPMRIDTVTGETWLFLPDPDKPRWLALRDMQKLRPHAP